MPDKTLHKSPQKRRRSRTTRSVATVLALAAAGGLSAYAATAAVGFLEARLSQDAHDALIAQGYDWAEVKVDGLKVHLRGTAPSEVDRYRAILLAEGAVEAGRIIDDLEVAAPAVITAPDFEVELLRNDEGISIIGLVPAGLERESVTKSLQKATGTARVTDLLETADYAVPDNWDAAFGFGLRAAELAERGKVSIAPGQVTVTAITDSREAKAALELALKRAKPANVALQMNISAPRPVISPFTLRFVKDQDGTRFDACAADTEAAREQILAAAAKAGLKGQANCQLGLGVPSKDWSAAAVAAIDAIGAFGGGQVTLSGTDVALQAPADTQQGKYDEVVARAQAALPPLYTLTATIAKGGAEQGPADFSAVSTDGGSVVLRGRITDQRMRDAVESFARSRFGQIDSALRLDDQVPSGWTVRVIAALEAMAGLSNGTAHVSPDLIRITGISGDQTASDLAATHLAERLGAGANYELAIRYDRRLDPLLGLPSGAECVDRLNLVMRESLIGFEPNKSVIAGDPTPTLERLKEALTNCTDFRIEIGGHTDAQGSEAFNAELSRKRAQAVLEAMTKAGIDTTLISARGYGESMPIADNDTDAGREANRRIEFTRLADAPVQAEPGTALKTVSGVTTDPDPGEMQGPQLPESDQASLPADGDGEGQGDSHSHGEATATGSLPQDSAVPAQPNDATPATEPLVVGDALRDYAEMMATILVDELAQMGHLGADEMPFDGGGFEGDDANGAEAAQDATGQDATAQAQSGQAESGQVETGQDATATNKTAAAAANDEQSGQGQPQQDVAGQGEAGAAMPAETPTTDPTANPPQAAQPAVSGTATASDAATVAAPLAGQGDSVKPEGSQDQAAATGDVAAAVSGASLTASVVVNAEQPSNDTKAPAASQGTDAALQAVAEAAPAGAGSDPASGAATATSAALAPGAAVDWGQLTAAAASLGLAAIGESVSVMTQPLVDATPRPQPRPQK
ncbi:OmpA family protein [Paracoccus sp. (in: a-proteobacteria)]|uniref:OmpA family protein n=1 Tax=Paracoccus sp. TaxID=267 RepID=UPI0028A1B6E9|nr:OmpA family protein [Paracoccus sp. (in: a-proteobacteria)]